MPSLSSLEIRGYRSEEVANTFWRQPSPADHLAIVLPGIAYTAAMPVLYYPGQLLVENGADLLQVEYAYHRRPEYQRASEEERARWLFADVSAAFQAALSQRSYGRITLIGKSLGTLAMAHLLETEPRLQTATCLFLTPVLADASLLRQIPRLQRPNLLAIGTADPFYNPALLESLKQSPHCQVVEFPNANHSLQVEGDIQRCLPMMEELLRRIRLLISS